MNAPAHRDPDHVESLIADHATGLEQEIIELVRSARSRPNDEQLRAQLETLYDELARTADALARNGERTPYAA